MDVWPKREHSHLEHAQSSHEGKRYDDLSTSATSQQQQQHFHSLVAML